MSDFIFRFIRLVRKTVTPLVLLIVGTSGPLAAPLPEQLKGHGGPIEAIDLSDDGSRALTASFDYGIIYWDLSGSQARIIHRLNGHDAAVSDVTFAPGEKRAVSGSADGSIGLWDLEQGTLIKRIKAENYKVHDVTVSDDGKYAAAARWDGTAKLYDLENQEEVTTLRGHKGNVFGVAFSKDGRYLYTGAYDGQIIEWDIATGDMIRPVYRHGWGINTLVRIDENRLLFGGLDGTVGIVGIDEAEQISELAKSDRPIQSVKVSPDATFMAYSDGAGSISVFKVSDGEPVGAAPVAIGPVWDFDFVPGTSQIYHVGLDDFAALWQVSPPDFSPPKSKFPRRFQVKETDDPGELEFRRKCSVCHTLTPDGANRAGPTLYKIFGRRVGTLPGYVYSEALLSANFRWNETTIAQLFDEGPDVMLPGTKMPLQKLTDTGRRDALIQFLKTATEPELPPLK